MAEKRPRLPLLLSANDLRSGLSVYFDGQRWVGEIGDALIARDEAAAAYLDEVRGESMRGTQVVDPFLISVALTSDAPAPLHYRELSRLSGPSFRDDFGRNGVVPERELLLAAE